MIVIHHLPNVLPHRAPYRVRMFSPGGRDGITSASGDRPSRADAVDPLPRCYAPLMGLLFVGGIMNLLVIGLIACWVAIEKTFSWGRRVAALTAGGLLTCGGGLIFFAIR